MWSTQKHSGSSLFRPAGVALNTVCLECCSLVPQADDQKNPDEPPPKGTPQSHVIIEPSLDGNYDGHVVLVPPGLWIVNPDRSQTRNDCITDR